MDIYSGVLQASARIDSVRCRGCGAANSGIEPLNGAGTVGRLSAIWRIAWLRSRRGVIARSERVA